MRKPGTKKNISMQCRSIIGGAVISKCQAQFSLDLITFWSYMRNNWTDTCTLHTRTPCIHQTIRAKAVSDWALTLMSLCSFEYHSLSLSPYRYWLDQHQHRDIVFRNTKPLIDLYDIFCHQYDFPINIPSNDEIKFLSHSFPLFIGYFFSSCTYQSNFEPFLFAVSIGMMAWFFEAFI